MNIHRYRFERVKPLAKLSHITSYDHIPVGAVKPIARQFIGCIRQSMGGRSRDVTAGRVWCDVIHVAGADADVAVYCYQLPSDEVRPAVVFLHGGGWIGGSISAVEHFCMALADRADVVVFAVDYRLAPEHVFPINPCAMTGACHL